MIPYTRHHITPEDEAAVLRALHSGYLTQGPEVEAFEAELAEKAGAKYCIAVNSGTAALHLAYLAAGVGPEKGIVTSPISFVATANAALYCGAEVEFCDLLSMKSGDGVITVPVTLGGNWPIGPEVPGIGWIIDACHGPLALPAGALAACFSFHPAKHVACGEGGAVVTNDGGFAAQCRRVRDHGRQPREYIGRHDGAYLPIMSMFDLGFNYRLPEISAALGRSQLARYDWNVAERRKRAAVYDEAFAGSERIRPVPHGVDSARHLYQVLIENRDAVAAKLLERGIGTAVHYRPIHLQPYYRERFGYQPGNYPNAEYFGDHALSLPLFPTLTEAEQAHVITSVKEVVG